jgi:hypothetical protein
MDVLGRLADRGLLQNTRGRKLTADGAADNLQHGAAVVIKHPTVGTVVNASAWVDTSSSRDFDDFNPFEATRQSLLANAWRGKAVAVQSEAELVRFNAVEKLAPGPDPRSPYLTRVSDYLQRHEGGPVQDVTLDRSDLGMNYYVCHGSHSDQNPGLYDLQTRQGGFLGIGTHPDRLTAYEAVKLLDNQHPVMIRYADGKAQVFRCLDEVHNQLSSGD